MNSPSAWSPQLIGGGGDPNRATENKTLGLCYHIPFTPWALDELGLADLAAEGLELVELVLEHHPLLHNVRHLLAQLCHRPEHILSTFTNIPANQCSGSVTFWYRSRSTCPCHWLRIRFLLISSATNKMTKRQFFLIDYRSGSDLFYQYGTVTNKMTKKNSFSYFVFAY